MISGNITVISPYRCGHIGFAGAADLVSVCGSVGGGGSETTFKQLHN